MIRFYTVLLLIALSNSGFSQTLTSSEAPPVNSMFLYYDANVPIPAFTFSTSGTGNTWDFSGLTANPVDDDSVFYLPPSNYPQSSAFPTATHATYEAGDGSINMLSVDANGGSLLGFITDPFGTNNMQAIVANPPATSINFPWTYGSNANVTTTVDIWGTGTDIGQPTLVDSVHVRNTVNFVSDVVASGNLILPSATYPSLLERQIQYTHDTTWVKGPISSGIWAISPVNGTSASVDSSYYWYSDQSLAHYAHVLYSNNTIDDVHYFKSQQTLGVENITAHNNLVAYPNPTRDFLGVKGLNFPPATEWNIYNLSGCEVLSGKSSLNSLNVQSLAQGTYFLRLITTSGEIRKIKFVKN